LLKRYKYIRTHITINPHELKSKTDEARILRHLAREVQGLTKLNAAVAKETVLIRPIASSKTIAKILEFEYDSSNHGKKVR